MAEFFVTRRGLVWVASLLIASASWAAGLPAGVLEQWSDLGTVNNCLSLLGVLGAVTLAWLGESPINNRRQQ